MFCIDITNVIASFLPNSSVKSLVSLNRDSWKDRHRIGFYEYALKKHLPKYGIPKNLYLKKLEMIPYGVEQLHLFGIHLTGEMKFPDSIKILSLQKCSGLFSPPKKLEQIEFLQCSFPIPAKQFVPETVKRVSLGDLNGRVRDYLPEGIDYVKISSFDDHFFSRRGGISK